MDWPHVHLALNHVPVLGTVFLFLLLVVGLLKRSHEIQKLAFQGFVLLTIATIPIKMTGDFAAEKASSDWDKALILKHEESADQATAGIFFLGVAALAGLIGSRKKSEFPVWAISLVLVLSLLTMVLMNRTAHAGGLINHPELR